ncbi:DnaA/Hda family protein [Streptomyces iakyrus]|uniref:DnaA ATPase domain-containing protein n=1 Tax=Streptomyces iakyrus TaxID=68219 RepID=UPI0033ABE0EA
MAKSLEPLDSGLSDEVRELADALRRLFEALGIGVRRYAARRHRDAGSVSRYLNGTRIPSWEFVADLLSDVAEVRGALTAEAVEVLRRLHSNALAASGSPQHRVRLLELQLVDADRTARRSAVRERALEDALLDAQHRVADLELQLRQLSSAPDPQAVQEEEWFEDDLVQLREERDELKMQVEDLRVELKEAHTRRLHAERRCEELERELEAAEEGPLDPDLPRKGDGHPSRETYSAKNVLLSAHEARPRESSERQTPNSHAHNLDTRFSFENFAVDSTNRFAHDAAVEVAEAPGGNYNPLYLYGSFGRGKTHLLHAIGNYARTLYPKSRPRYSSLKEVIKHMRGAMNDSSRASAVWSGSDILLLDDFDCLQGGGGPQESLAEWIHDALKQSKQIVFASALPVREFSSLNPDLAELVRGGLSIGTSTPTPQQLVAVLDKKVLAEGIEAPRDVLELIATSAGGSIRELEGALTRVAAYASLNSRPIDANLARFVLTGLRKESTGEVTGETVLLAVTRHFDVSLDALRASERGRRIVGARHAAMYLCRELTDYSVPTIAALLGSKDPSAVLHAHKKTRNLMNQRRSKYDEITAITNEILFPDASVSRGR